MDVEGGNTAVASSKVRKTLKFALYGSIAAVLVIVILACTVLKPKNPVNVINSITVDCLNIGTVDSFNRSSDFNLNLTLKINASIVNPNKVGLKYTDAAMLVYCRGQLIGKVQITTGEISSRETKDMDLKATISTTLWSSNPDLSNDIATGALPLHTYAKLSGKVKMYKVFEVHVVSYSLCDFVVNLIKGVAENQACRYRTKF